MSTFRGSRRLMARIRQHNIAKQANRQAASQRFSEDEIKLRRRLDREATKGWDTQPGLIKAPKAEA